MVDWPGLLKWTLSTNDGTTSNPYIKPMDDETKKWLEEALETYTFNEAKRMNEIVQELIKPENRGDATEEDKRVALLEELEELVEGLENARDLVRMGIYGPLIQVMLSSSYPKVRKTIYFIFASCNSNNPFVQMASVESGAFKLVNSIIQETSLVGKEAAFAALSSMVRGDSLPIKRNFIDIEGVEFLLEILSNDNAYNSNKMRVKAMTLLGDLVFYDDKLDYLSMDEFNKNDAQGKKVNSKSSWHVPLGKEKKPEETKANGQQTQPAIAAQEALIKYKNIVKKKLIEKNFIALGLKYLTQDNLRPQTDLRNSYFSIVASLIKFDKKCKPSKDYFERIDSFSKILAVETKNHEGLFDTEIGLIKNVVSLK